MTRINGRHVIFEDDVLERKVTRWVKKAGGQTHRNISEIFETLKMAFPIVLTESTLSNSLEEVQMECETADGKKYSINLSENSMITIENIDEKNGTRTKNTYLCDFEKKRYKLYKTFFESEDILMKTTLDISLGCCFIDIKQKKKKVIYNCSIKTSQAQKLYYIIEEKRGYEKLKDFFGKTTDILKVKEKFETLLKGQIKGMVNIIEERKIDDKKIWEPFVLS